MWTCSKLRYQHPLPVESMGSRAVHIMEEFISGSLRFVFGFDEARAGSVPLLNPGSKTAAHSIQQEGQVSSSVQHCDNAGGLG